jgi:hypothetical protein
VWPNPSLNRSTNARFARTLGRTPAFYYVTSSFNRRITRADFDELVAPLLGLPISGPWRGYGSTLFFELGRLRDEPLLATHGRLAGGSSRKGEATVMIHWSWRVE